MENFKYKIGEDKSNFISLAAALFFTTEFLCYSLPGLGIGTFFRISYAVDLIIIALLITNLILKQKFIITVNKLPTIYFLIIIAAVLICSTIVPDFTFDLSKYFLSFILGIIIVSLKLNTEEILRYILYISWIIVPGYDVTFAYQWEVLNQAGMGAVYSALVLATAGIFHFVYFRKKRRRIFYINYIPTIVTITGIAQYGNRGCVLSLVAIIVLIVFNRASNFKENKPQINLITKKRILLVAGIALAGYVVLNFNQLFMIVYSYAENIFAELPSFFVKMYKYISLDDVANGRSDVYDMAIKLIRQNPLFGYGIGSFLHYGGFEYPHNFFLQLWLEMGIFAVVIPTAAILFALYKLFLSQLWEANTYVMLAFLTVQVIPRFLVSADIWRDRYFWILIFYVLYNFNYMRRNSSELYQSEN